METVKVCSLLNSDIDILGLSVRSYNALKRANIKTIGDILGLKKVELSTVRALGKNSFEEVVLATEKIIFDYPELKIGLSKEEIKELGLPYFYFNEEERLNVAKILDSSIDTLSLGTKQYNFLHRSGIRTIRQLVSIKNISEVALDYLSEKDIKGIENALEVFSCSSDVHLGMDHIHLDAIPRISQATDNINYSNDSLFSCFPIMNVDEKKALYHSLLSERCEVLSRLNVLDDMIAVVKISLEKDSKVKKIGDNRNNYVKNSTD